jgi:hypothetical protein
MDEVRSNNSGKIFLPSGIVIDIREFVKTNIDLQWHIDTV